jgi:hypothetical protein
MSWWDVLETAGSSALGIADALGHVAPGVGEVLSAEQSLYHAGSAIYDGVTGDRDGAISHGTQALYNGVTAIPGISEVAGLADLAVSVPTSGMRATMQAVGEDPEYMPGGISDVLSQAAVGATRALFGEDDSNWIAEGDAPTGTRRGEIMAGTAMMAAASSGGLSDVITSGGTSLIRMATSAQGGAELGGYAADLLAENPDGPTSGVDSNPGLVGELVQSALSRDQRTEGAAAPNRSRRR